MFETLPTLAECADNANVFSGETVMPRSLISASLKSVLDTVGITKKATGYEIARHAGISCAETINSLLYLEQYGLVTQLNGYWMLPASTSEWLCVDDDLNRRIGRRRKVK